MKSAKRAALVKWQPCNGEHCHMYITYAVDSIGVSIGRRDTWKQVIVHVVTRAPVRISREDLYAETQIRISKAAIITHVVSTADVPHWRHSCPVGFQRFGSCRIQSQKPLNKGMETNSTVLSCRSAGMSNAHVSVLCPVRPCPSINRHPQQCIQVTLLQTKSLQTL